MTDDKSQQEPKETPPSQPKEMPHVLPKEPDPRKGESPPKAER